MHRLQVYRQVLTTPSFTNQTPSLPKERKHCLDLWMLLHREPKSHMEASQKSSFTKIYES